MKISTNWINDYVNIEGLNLKEIADKVTNCGVNVESIDENIEIEGLITGKVLTCEDHPESDHLHICTVDIKSEILNIICGAPNVGVNQKVIVAKVGAVLPGDFEIQKRVIRGKESNGMICALNEIGLSNVYTGGIHIMDESTPVGENPYKYLKAKGTVYTLDLNPNRNDCLSHLGFAYEVAAVLNKKIETPNIEFKELNENISDYFKLLPKTDKCPLIILKLVKNIKIKESPDFIVKRLEESGMRSINNVVDISNYIMLEYGQPIHFYDADKVNGSLGVRMAYENEKLITLDEKERILSTEDIVITNGVDSIGLAGVMGGKDTEITKSTKNILIESAIFDPLSIRKTSIKLDLRSEASLRFEKGLNFEYTYDAIKRACHLLEKYAGGTPTEGSLVHDEIDKTPKKASVTLEKINSILGLNLDVEDVKKAFDCLGFEYTNEFDVTIPNRRMDVSIMEDLIEEIGRMYGYSKIVGKFPVQESKRGGYSPRIKYRKDISKKLRSLGLNEVKTYSLINEAEALKFHYEKGDIIKLDRPISKVKTHLRTSLIPSLIEVVKYNEARSTNDINIYEISNTYIKDGDEFKEIVRLGFLIKGEFFGSTWNKTLIKSDFYLLKGLLENLMHYLGFEKRFKLSTEKNYDFMHPGVSAEVIVDNEKVGFLGKIHPSIIKEEIYVCELNLDKLFSMKTGKIKYEEPSKYPGVNRDIAFLFDKNIIVGEVLKDIKNNGGNILKKVLIFDIFEKDDKKSVAFSLKFIKTDKTLVENEVNEVIENIINNISKKYNAILRDK